MNQRTNNSVLLKRLKGWLALMMAVTMLFGSSMTVFAADYTYSASNVREKITTSTKYYGGDTIRYNVSGGKVLVYVKGVEMKRDYNGSYYVVTLSGDASVEYTVSDIVIIDEYSAGLYLSADIPVTKYLDPAYDENGSMFVDGISVGDTLSAGDSIEYFDDVASGGFKSVTLIIDGAMVDNAWGDGNSYTFDKDVIVTNVECYIDAEYDRYATISFISSGSGSNNNSGNDTSKDEGEEFKEEPKENEEHIFTRELLEQAAGAKSGDSMVIDATLWHSFNANVLKELLSKEGVSYTFYYNYGGECFYITIPAGAVLEEGCEWYGPLKLSAMFGRIIIDKKDLHAAINK